MQQKILLMIVKNVKVNLWILKLLICFIIDTVKAFWQRNDKLHILMQMEIQKNKWNG
jgi:hypothetical protein